MVQGKLSIIGNGVVVDPWSLVDEIERARSQGLKIDPSLFREDDVEILEDLILAAHNDAKAKVEAAMQEKTRELTAGLPIPPGMKLPF